MYIPILLFIGAMGLIANSEPPRKDRHCRRGWETCQLAMLFLFLLFLCCRFLRSTPSPYPVGSCDEIST